VSGRRDEVALEEPVKSAVVPQRLDQAAANTAAVASPKNPDKRILPSISRRQLAYTAWCCRDRASTGSEG
jgi:hypothetical protein